jgi:hypothetical protein
LWGLRRIASFHQEHAPAAQRGFSRALKPTKEPNMIKRLLVGLLLLATPAAAQMEPPGATPISASSGNVANAPATATLTGAAGRWTYVCGVSFTPGFATAGTAVTATITDTAGGTLTFTVSTTPNTAGPPPVPVRFDPCLASNSIGVNIVVSIPRSAPATPTRQSAPGAS